MVSTKEGVHQQWTLLSTSCECCPLSVDSGDAEEDYSTMFLEILYFLSKL